MTPLFKIINMYKKNKPNRTSLKQNTGYEGETIEKKINRIVNNKEPIKDGAPIIYTDRRDGVHPEYDIRTDRFEIALDATDLISKTHITKRQDFHTDKTKIENEEKSTSQELKNLKEEFNTLKEQQSKNNAGGEPIQATDQ